MQRIRQNKKILSKDICKIKTVQQYTKHLQCFSELVNSEIFIVAIAEDFISDKNLAQNIKSKF